MATKKPPAKKKARKTRPKQGHLPGMEPPNIPELNKAADAYVSLRDARMREGMSEREARLILQALMKKHELPKYEYDSRIVEVVTATKIKVRKASEGDEDEEGEEE